MLPEYLVSFEPASIASMVTSVREISSLGRRAPLALIIESVTLYIVIEKTKIAIMVRKILKKIVFWEARRRFGTRGFLWECERELMVIF